MKYHANYLVSCLLGLSLLSIADAAVELKQDTLARNFGYVIGDLVSRQINLEIEQPHELLRDQIPAVGKLNRWLELRSSDLKVHKSGRLTRYELMLEYQIISSEANKPKIFLPGFELTLVLPERSLPLVFQSLPVQVIRVTEEDPSRTLQVLDLQPPIAPEPVSLFTTWLKLFASLAGIIVSLLIAVYIYIGLPWLRQFQGPFAKACKKLRHLPDSAKKTSQQTGLRYLHEAFNETYGRVLLHDDLAEFLRQHPAFNQIGPELTEFFVNSRALFFGDSDKAVGSVDELMRLCQQCRDIERGLL